jgi:hypothetical protein
MLKLLQNNKAQNIFAEYSIIFFLVVAFMSAMGLYIRRTLQARVIGAAGYITREVNAVLADNTYYNYVGKYHRQYEPYYVASQGERTIDQEIDELTLPAGNAGIYEKQHIRDITNMYSVSDQLSPQYAD